MSAPKAVSQGEDCNLEFNILTDASSGYTYLLEAKKYPDDTAAISRSITLASDGSLKATLTPSETANLDAGLWYISVKATDADEEIHGSQRIEIKRAWI